MPNKKIEANTIIKSITILTLFMVIVIAAVSIWFRNTNSTRVTDNNVTYLEEAVRQKVELVEAELSKRLITIQNYSYVYNSNTPDEKNLTTLLRSWEEIKLFDHIRFIDKNGVGYTSKGLTVDCSNEEFYLKGIKGIADYYATPIEDSDDMYIAFYAPTFDKINSITGVMVGYIGKDKINDILESFFFDAKANVMLMQNDGEVISYTTDVKIDASIDDMYEIVASIGNLTPETIMQIRENLSKGEGVTVEYVGSAGTNSHARIEPLSKKSWYIVESFPTRMEKQMVDNANQTADDMIWVLAFIILTYLVFVCMEYREYKKQDEALKKEIKISRTDPMTELGNRTAYEEDMLAASKTELDPDTVMISLDLNELKHINDNFGHAKGDEIIIVAGKMIRDYFASYGSIYRIGGDEFTGVLKMPKMKIEPTITELNKKIAEYEDSDEVQFSISIGYVCVSDNPGMDVYELAKLADIQMYRCKSQYYASEGHDRRIHKQ